ncbi:MAG: lysylphosphatidylglycerol synthase transmembrane domain-containing protein [Bryobacteraceae bacterium]
MNKLANRLAQASQEMTDEEPRTPRLALLVVLIIAAVAILFQWKGRQFRWEVFVAALVNVDPVWYTCALLLLALTYFGRALRWRVMMLPICPNASLKRIFISTVVGFSAIVLLGRAGEGVRPYLIAKAEQVSVASQLATWVLERIYDLLFVVLIFGVSLTQINTSNVSAGPALTWMLQTGGWIMGAIGVVCTGVLVAVGSFSEFARGRIVEGLRVVPDKYRTKIESVLLAFVGGMESTRSRSFVLQLIALTAVEWMLIVLTNYCLFQSIDQTRRLSLVENMIFLGFIAFGSVVQIPGIGGGMQVASVLVLTELFGLQFEAATGISLLIWLTNSVAVMPFGLVLGIAQGINWRSLKAIEAQSDSGIGT